MRDRTRDSLTGTLLFFVSLFYYYILSSKIWSWLYVSGDSGDWMMFTNGWVVPQPFGSPLFIAAIRALGWLAPQADAYQLLTVCLSVIPCAVLTVLVYFISLKLTGERSHSMVASIVFLGMSIPLTQATVFEQYAFTAVFVAGAYLAFLHQRLSLATIMLGLGTAAHPIVGVVAVLWFASMWRDRLVIRQIPLFVVFGVLPYGLIVYLLATCDSLFYTGGLTLQGLNVYLGTTYLVGNLSIAMIPQRLLDVGAVLVSMLGLAVYPLIAGLKGTRDRRWMLAALGAGTMLWFWFSNSFFSTFKYVVIGAPFIAAFIAVGLTRLPKWHTIAIVAGAVVLMAVNAHFLDADRLTRDEPLATDFYDALWELPDGSAVLSPRGGAYGFSFFYALSEGKDLVPLLCTKAMPSRLVGQMELDAVYVAYLESFKSKYPGWHGNDSIELSRDALAKGLDLYFISNIEGTGWDTVYQYENIGNGINRITGVKMEDWHDWMEAIGRE